MTPLTGAAKKLGGGPIPSMKYENIIQLDGERLAQGDNLHQHASSVNAEHGRKFVAVGAAADGQGQPSHADVPTWLANAEKVIAQGGVPKKSFGYRFIKRAFDIVFSSCVIAVGLVPGIVLSAFIIRDTKGTPIYASTRTGTDGRHFRILKFRTMVADSDDLEKYFTQEQLEQWHREHKVDDDPRITRLGSVLRSTSIDEFPQFINVLFGQMSTVGCRAITDEEIAYFGPARELLLSMRPGITGMWQTGPRNIATFESGIRQELDLSYITSASVKLDASIILRTFRAMAERTGK